MAADRVEAATEAAVAVDAQGLRADMVNLQQLLHRDATAVHSQYARLL